LATLPPIVDRTQKAQAAKAVRREEILEAAQRVFARRGFKGTTIADIAEEAKVALGTIYLYFPSKQAVFVALNQRFAEAMTRAVTDSPPGRTLDEDVRQRVDRVFEVCSEHREMVRLLVMSIDPGSEVMRRMRKADRERNRPLREAIAAGMRRGAVRKGDPHVMTDLATGTIRSAIYQAFVVNDGQDAGEYREACGDMIVAYLSPPGADKKSTNAGA
jgi:AcrR family transcriptional regulator